MSSFRPALTDGKRGGWSRGPGGVLTAVAAVVQPCIDSLVAIWHAIPDEQRRQVGQVFELLTADARAAELTRRFQARQGTITYTEGVWLAAGLLWNRIPYSRANNATRPEDALPFIYDYEMQANRARRDESVLLTLIEQSKTKKLAFDALQAYVELLRRDGTPIEGVLRAWALEVAGGARTRPHRGREQTTEVRDAVISNTVQTLTQCGLSKTRNEASPPRSACDAVGEVLTMRYEAVVKACGRAAAA